MVSEVVPGLVSVVVPVYQRTALLRRAVASALAQTHEAVEVIVVDDGSADDTWECAQALASANPGRVFALRQENAGPGPARNRGLAIARGEFVQYLDSDDEILPRKFELQVAALRAHPQAAMAYGLTRRRDEATGQERDFPAGVGEVTQIFPGILEQRGWSTMGPLWRRSACEAIGPWGDFRNNEDLEHDLRAGLLGLAPVRVGEHLVTMHDHSGARASGMDTGFTAAFVHEMWRAHRSMWQHMRAAERTDASYLGRFARKVFWIARLCGERGLREDANEALAAAQEMSAYAGGSLQMRGFGVMTRVLGWKASVRLSEGLRRALRRGPEAAHA